MIVNHPRFAEFGHLDSRPDPVRRLADARRGAAARPWRSMPHVRLMHAYGHDRGRRRSSPCSTRATRRSPGPMPAASSRAAKSRRPARSRWSMPTARRCRPARRAKLAIRGANMMRATGTSRPNGGRARGRLVLLGRRRLHGHARLRLHRRPAEGHDHLGAARTSYSAEVENAISLMPGVGERSR